MDKQKNMGKIPGMTTFTESENAAAHQLYLDACALNTMAREKIGEYASPGDREAATIAVLLVALELAGGSHFIKPQEE